MTYKKFTGRNCRGPVKAVRPENCQFELTYRCPYNCVHCYSKCFDKKKFIAKELKYEQVISILDQIHQEGCLYLTLTGGEPLARPDFSDIYRYAKRKGFLISVFTNGYFVSDDILKLFKKSPPCSVEITVNGITKSTYEKIVRRNGSFERAISTISILAKARIPLVIKSNGLCENRDEILKTKAFTENLLGKKRFKFDSLIVPALDGSLEPCGHRLKTSEIIDIERSDADMIKQKNDSHAHVRAPRDRTVLYNCTSWQDSFYIDPYGRLKFCYLMNEFSSDLTRVPFRYAFYSVFPFIKEVPFDMKTKCKNCRLFNFCAQCPARSLLETGAMMKPVPYFCELAKSRFKEEMNHVHRDRNA